MLPQYPALPHPAAQLALAQFLAAQQAGHPALPAPAPLQTEAEPNIPTLIEPAPAPGYVGPPGPVEDSHLRHLIMGSPAGVRYAIDRLHLLDYVQRHYWTPLIAIGVQGIHLTPAHGQVLSYLVQQRPIR